MVDWREVPEWERWRCTVQASKCLRCGCRTGPEMKRKRESRKLAFIQSRRGPRDSHARARAVCSLFLDDNPIILSNARSLVEGGGDPNQPGRKFEHVELWPGPRLFTPGLGSQSREARKGA